MALLEVHDLHVYYGNIEALKGKIRLPSSTLKCWVTKVQKWSMTSSNATE